jgi:hypothetical protein
MHLTMFRSGKGDCLLLEGNTSGRVLVDAGMPDAYRDFVAAPLAKLRQQNKALDLVYVSHIDEDHIGGVLKMLDDEMAWRVHEHQISPSGGNNRTHPVPTVPRPPQIKKIWHNAFHEQLAVRPGVIEDTLAAMATVLAGSDHDDLLEAASAQADLATSVMQAIQVSRRIGAKQLNIPLNPDSDKKLMMRRENQTPIRVGSMRFTVLGPTGANLLRLRKDWKEWLDQHADTLQDIRDKAAEDKDLLGNSDLSGFRERLALQARQFGNPGSVTPPNLASLMLLAKEGSQTILLTGDARGDQIVDGLRAVGALPPAGGHLHVNVLKVQHHGAENNIDPEFCDTVTADHYVFCGNGENKNPNVDVVELIARHRFADGGTKKFKFWFNASAAVSVRGLGAHMSAVERKVDALQSEGHGRLKLRFLKSGVSLRVI